MFTRALAPCSRALSARNQLPYAAQLRSSGTFLLVEAFAALYDSSFWMVRHLVRIGEKDRPSGMSQNPDFGLLHGTANHIFHLKETIESAEHTVESLILEIGRWTNNYRELARDHVIRWTQIQQDLRFIEKVLSSYQLCSGSLWERHDIEINYALNITDQQAMRDSIAMKQDNAAMKTIAALSLVYLPGTFVSACSGRTSSTCQRTVQGRSGWCLKTFLYWLITIPLTALTTVVWKYPGAARGLAVSEVNLVNYTVMKTQFLKRKWRSNDTDYLEKNEAV